MGYPPSIEAGVTYWTARLVRDLCGLRQRLGITDGEIGGRRCGRGHRGSLSPLMPPSTARMVPVVDADRGLAR